MAEALLVGVIVLAAALWLAYSFSKPFRSKVDFFCNHCPGCSPGGLIPELPSKKKQPHTEDEESKGQAP